MKKTISINLNNQVFVIEEAGYEKLYKYLEQIKVHCGSDVDVNEVIKDIEASMVDKLKATLNEYKQVVVEGDVDELIKVMGTIEEFAREAGEETKSNDNVKRRLYRDTDNAIVAGVAAGLSNYFDIDPVLIRVLFAASLFMGGFGFILYIILWLAMPEAKTAQQKLEMRGQTPSLAAFENIAKASKVLTDKWNNFSGFKKIVNFPFLVLKQVFVIVKKIFLRLVTVIRICSGLFLIVFSLFFIGVVGVGSVFLILQDKSLYSISNIPVTDIVSVLPFTWLVISGFLTVILPLIFLFFAGLAVIRKKIILNFVAVMVMLAVWMFAGMVFIGTTLRYVPEVQSVFKNHVNSQVTEKKLVDKEVVKEINFNGSDLNVDVEFVDELGVKISGRKSDVDKIQTTFNDSILTLAKNNDDINNFCINCSRQRIKIFINTKYKNIIEINDRARVNIINGDVDNLSFVINNHSYLAIDSLKAKGLKINIDDNSSLNINGEYKNIELNTENSEVVCQNCLISKIVINSTNSQIKLNGEMDELLYKGVASSDNNSLNLSKAQIKKANLETKGESILVINDIEKATYLLSDLTKVIYGGQNKVDKNWKKENVLMYKKIGEREYYNLINKSEQPETLINSMDGYYLLDKGVLTEDQFEQLKESFLNNSY